MKNILSFDALYIYRCHSCGCIFNIDNFDTDLKTINLNCREMKYTKCPNCQTMCTEGFIINSALYDAKNKHIDVSFEDGKFKPIFK